MKSERKAQGFDVYEEQRQTGLRLEILRLLVLAVFVALGVRLWWLQVMNHEVFAGQAESNRMRVIPIPARRGTIYDRQGRELVTSRISFNIVVSRTDVANFAELTDLLTANLEIDRAWIEKRFEEAKYEPRWESIVVKEMASPAEVAWVRAHRYEHPEVRAEEAPQRLYLHGALAAHAL
ncbi:MAG TPA: hypothetical protein VFB52_12790, partial [Solirubrobacterales bacterium]|nr:hypothetical protein [Solirubrobacterales bacterium]